MNCLQQILVWLLWLEKQLHNKSLYFKPIIFRVILATTCWGKKPSGIASTAIRTNEQNCGLFKVFSIGNSFWYCSSSRLFAFHFLRGIIQVYQECKWVIDWLVKVMLYAAGRASWPPLPIPVLLLKQQLKKQKPQDMQILKLWSIWQWHLKLKNQKRTEFLVFLSARPFNYSFSTSENTES